MLKWVMRDLSNQKFGSLVPIKIVGKNKATHSLWLCRCDCGNTHIVDGTCLTRGQSKSCGCLLEKWRKENTYIYRNELKKFRRTYAGIQERCYCQKQRGYKNYGGRGIKCLWQSFKEFKNDMYESFLTHHKLYGGRQTTIDRIDNDGHYCKENCRWATMKEQMQNKRPRQSKRFL